MLDMWAHLCPGVTVKDSQAHRVVVLCIICQERFGQHFGVPCNTGGLTYTGQMQYGSSTDTVAGCHAKMSECVQTCGDAGLWADLVEMGHPGMG